MLPSIQTKIESLNDLNLFARLHEIDETPESLKTLWQERPEPIKVGSAQESIISQIMKGWFSGTTFP